MLRSNQQHISTIDTSGESSIQNAAIEEFESEVLRQALQQSQLSIAQYCLSVISSTANLLQLYLQEPELFGLIVQLHQSLMELLNVEDLRKTWGEDDNRSKKVVSQSIYLEFKNQLQKLQFHMACNTICDMKFLIFIILNIESQSINDCFQIYRLQYSQFKQHIYQRKFIKRRNSFKNDNEFLFFFVEMNLIMIAVKNFRL